MQSLRDKLLKAGLVTEDAAKKSETEAKAKPPPEQRAASPRSDERPASRGDSERFRGPPRGAAPSAARGDGDRFRSAPPRSATPYAGRSDGERFRSAPPRFAAALPKLPPLAGTAAANRLTSLAQLENDRKIRERVSATQVPLEPGATTFHFVTRKNKLRRLDLSEAQVKALQDGTLAIVERPDPGQIEHALVPADVANELKALSDKVVRYLNRPGEAVGFLSDEEIHARATEEATAEAAAATASGDAATPGSPATTEGAAAVDSASAQASSSGPSGADSASSAPAMFITVKRSPLPTT